ncbi:MAG TPA: HAD hydrolase family protein [Gemmatimonadaceae bacterium]
MSAHPTCRGARKYGGRNAFAIRWVSCEPYYLDVTNPTANKGLVIERLSHYIAIPLDRIAAIGDQPNDVLMFERAGLSIAMGNASDEVKRRATFVTTSFADEGFANAIEQIVLPRAEPAGARDQW